MHPSLTSFDFRYIQLAINVPTLSTLLYIWSDILNSTLSLFWASLVHKSSRKGFSEANIHRCENAKVSLQDHSRVTALALVQREGD